jgi:hypothetical protein
LALGFALPRNRRARDYSSFDAFRSSTAIAPGEGLAFLSRTPGWPPLVDSTPASRPARLLYPRPFDGLDLKWRKTCLIADFAILTFDFGFGRRILIKASKQ